MALTKNDINLLKESFKDTFATKEDFAQFATKKDLGRFATKDDLAKLATKDDLENFATKNDLQNGLHGMRNDLLQAIEDKSRITVDLLRSEIKASEVRVKREIISEVTEFIGNNLVPQLDNHEQRLTKLETAHV